MTSNQFFVPDLDPRSPRLILEGDEHHHLSRVARVKPGETVRIFDGRGTRCLARVESISRERTVLAVVRGEESADAGLKLVLVQGLLTSRMMEFVLQKAAELGTAEFVPLETERSMKASPGKSGRKSERWEKIAREAVKQSKGGRVPVVHDSVSFDTIFEFRGQDRRIYLSENEGRPLKEILLDPERQGIPPPGSALLAVGPKGGWAEWEEGSFRAQGFEAASLGERILKAETAAVAAAAMMIHFWSG